MTVTPQSHGQVEPFGPSAIGGQAFFSGHLQQAEDVVIELSVAHV
jgi:hypothetical protein